MTAIQLTVKVTATASLSIAEVVELVDTLASGASGGNPVKVQVLFSAPFSYTTPVGL